MELVTIAKEIFGFCPKFTDAREHCIMAIKRRPITAVHAKDPAWIIALWIAIHGGDPAPEISAKKANEAAMAIIRALTAHLDPAAAKAVVAALGQ
jgi:hypothetical protein